MLAPAWQRRTAMYCLGGRLAVVCFFAAVCPVRMMEASVASRRDEATVAVDSNATRNPYLLCMGVYSSPTEEAKNRRKEIRSTYWQHKLLNGKGAPILAKFVVGWTEKTDAAALAFNEEKKEKPNEFLVLDVKESYRNLTLKTFNFLRWFASNSVASYVLKMDDDTYPHLYQIETFLNQQTDEYLHLGMKLACAPVLKFTKWAENPSVWNHSYFPQYMQGSGYFLSAPLVDKIIVEHYDNSKKHMLNNEDAAVGLWVEMERWQDMNIEIQQLDIPATLTGCHNTDLLSMNNQIGYMGRYWARFMEGNGDVCNERKQKLMLLQMSSRARVRARTRARMRAGCYAE